VIVKDRSSTVAAIEAAAAPARPQTGAELLVRALELEEVEYIFGVPGEENLDLLEAIRTSSIKFIVTRHEQVAGFMASTYGRLTGKPGVCLSTLGPGATNLVTAAAYASLGGMPMLMITGQKSIFHRRQARFQIVDTVAMMRPLTKSARQVIDAGNIPTLIRDAFRTAQSERPGPVHLELPEDIAAEIVTEPHFVSPSPIHSSIASAVSIMQAAAAISRARHPLIVIGGGANRPGQALGLSAAIRELGIPFFNTQMGKGAINGNSDLYIGTAALSTGDYVHLAVERADLIIAVGHDTAEKPPFLMRAGGPVVVHVGFSPAEVDQIYFPQIEVIGEIADSMCRLGHELGGRHAQDSLMFPVRDLVLERTSDGNDDPRYPLAPQRLVADVRKVMPKDGILCLDNGMYKIWFARNYRTDMSNTLLLDNALATMGAGLPSAMMAAMLYPSRRVMAVCGDGGFMMNSQDIETAVRLGLNLVVLIIEDNAYGMIRWKQGVDGFPDFGLTFNNPDFVQYARAYGATGVRIASADGLIPALEMAFEAGGIHIVVAAIDYSENHRVLVDELSSKKATVGNALA
jgi:acetolactate synthase-1/2/3 large subunit